MKTTKREMALLITLTNCFTPLAGCTLADRSWMSLDGPRGYYRNLMKLTKEAMAADYEAALAEG